MRGAYYAQRVVPCECGSREAYWHGPEDGLREYACDPCWQRMEEIRAMKIKPCCERHRRYLGGLCRGRR